MIRKLKYLKEFNIFNEVHVNPPIESLKNGDRIELISMWDDLDPIQPGEKGTILRIEPYSKTIEMKWDNGRTLNLLHDQDQFKIIDNE
jgi:hypothetical protein